MLASRRILGAVAKRAQCLSSIQPNVNENSPVMAWNEWDPLEEVNIQAMTLKYSMTLRRKDIK